MADPLSGVYKARQSPRFVAGRGLWPAPRRQAK